jgi:hypothetical protein
VSPIALRRKASAPSAFKALAFRANLPLLSRSARLAPMSSKAGFPGLLRFILTLEQH